MFPQVASRAGESPRLSTSLIDLAGERQQLTEQVGQLTRQLEALKSPRCPDGPDWKGCRVFELVLEDARKPVHVLCGWSEPDRDDSGPIPPYLETVLLWHGGAWVDPQDVFGHGPGLALHESIERAVTKGRR